MIFAILGFILAVWAIRSICIKQQSIGKKIGKSFFSVWYFLTAAGLALPPTDSAQIAVIMLVAGALVVWYCNRNYKAPANANDVLSDYAEAIKEFDFPAIRKILINIALLIMPKVKLQKLKISPFHMLIAKVKAVLGMLMSKVLMVSTSKVTAICPVNSKRSDLIALMVTLSFVKLENP